MGTLAQFAAVAETIRAARGKREKTRHLAELLRGLPDADLAIAATFFAGQVFPRGSGRALQIGYASLAAAAQAAVGAEAEALWEAYQRWSDVGDAMGDLFAARDIPSGLSLAEVAAILRELADLPPGEGKARALATLLGRLSAAEARYLVKVLAGELRIGLQEGLVEDAIAVAFGAQPPEVRRAHQRLTDIGRLALAARAGLLAAVAVELFQPLKPMLATPETLPETLTRRLGPTLWVEDKYDGVRAQAHVGDGRVALYSRDLKDVTAQFPEVATALTALPGRLILDGELLAQRDGRALPFSDLQKRLGRKRISQAALNQTPVVLCLFDLLLQQDSLLDRPLRERRGLLETLPLGPGLLLAPRRLVAPSALEAEFAEAKGRANEGLMIKDPDSPYTPGRRGANWLKYKKALEPLDVVVTGVEYGHGKRHGVLSDYTFAVRDEETGELVNLGKAYTGLTDAEIGILTEYFLAHTVERYGRFHAVRPELVLEVAFEAIQVSPRHKSGFALRFPRILRVRPDKSPAEVSTLADVRRAHAAYRAPYEVPAE